MSWNPFVLGVNTTWRRSSDSNPLSHANPEYPTYGLGGILGSLCFTFGPYFAKYRRKAEPSLVVAFVQCIRHR